MPWKECHVEDERLRFVARLLDGEKMARLCAEFEIPGNRLQDLRPLPGRRAAGIDRSQSAAVSAREPAADGDREDDCPAEARVPELRRPEDPRAAPPALSRGAVPGDQHRARRAGPPWAGDTPEAPAATRRRYRPLSSWSAQ